MPAFRILPVLLLTVFSLLGAAEWKPVDPARIRQVQAWLTEKPVGFGLPVTRRDVWDDPAFRERGGATNFIARAEALLGESYPEWSDEAYLEFSKNGKRPGGERMLGARQKWLHPLVMAELFENKGRFLPTIHMVMTALCTQPSWTLPAHDRKLLNFKRSEYSAELNSAPLAHELAQAVYLLRSRLDPDVRQTVELTILDRVLDPVRSNMTSGVGPHWWLRGDNNWNVVCWQGAFGAAMAILPDAEDRAWWVAAAEDGARYYVDAKADDGYDTEGAGYWAYAMDNFNGLRENLLRVTGGRLDLYASPKVRNAALFGARIAMNGGYAPSYGDCRINTRVNEKVLGYLDRSLGLGIGVAYEPKLGPSYAFCMDLFSNSTTVPKKAGASGEDLARSWFPDAGVLVCRDAGPAPRLSASIKGGGNQNHNHNDVGSFVIHFGDAPMAGDCGGPWAYNGDMFDKVKRWEYKSLNSFGHPVPVFGGVLQMDSRQAKPIALSNRFTPEVDEVWYELKSAYEMEGLRTWTRHFRFERKGEGSVVVEDRFEFAEPRSVELGLPTFCDFAPVGRNQIRLTSVSTDWKQTAPGNYVLQTPTSPSNRRSLLVTVETPDGFTLTNEDVEVNAPPFHRLGFTLNKPVAKAVTRMTFRPEALGASSTVAKEGATLPWTLDAPKAMTGTGSYAGVDIALSGALPYRKGSVLRFRLEGRSESGLNPPSVMLSTADGRIAYLNFSTKWKDGAVEVEARLPEKPATHPSAKSPGPLVEGDGVVKIRLYAGMPKPSPWSFEVKSLRWEEGK